MKMKTNTNSLAVIGRTTTVAFVADGASSIPAKVDTGADSSSVWASALRMSVNGVLSFVLFDESSPFYTGLRHSTRSYRVSRVRSSNGLAEIRYQVKMTVTIDGKRVRGTFTLADRSRNRYPILIGCRLLAKKFLVDVSRGDAVPAKKKGPLNIEMNRDPVAFFEKYSNQNQIGGVET